MPLKVGDSAFIGPVPGMVTGVEPVKGYTVSTNPEEVRENFRHGYIDGLTEDNRQEFYEIMDDVASLDDPREKISKLQEDIERMQRDPARFRITRYLKAEMSHLMNSHRIKPSEYVIPMNKAP